MGQGLDDRKSIFLQIKQRIEDQIVNGQLVAHDQIPSTTQLVQFYKVNHITVAKGINLLVDEGVVYKKRGVGMFVAEGAREMVKGKRKQAFKEEFIRPLVLEAEKLGVSEDELLQAISEVKGEERS